MRIILKRREYLAATASSGSEMKKENSMSRKVTPTVPIFFFDVSGKRVFLFLLLAKWLKTLNQNLCLHYRK
jgi:hypothetical protein